MSDYHSKPISDLTPAQREETMRRSQELRRKIEESRPTLNPDRDFSWENTDFKEYEND